MKKGKLTRAVYVYLVPKKDWPKKVNTQPILGLNTAYVDLDMKRGRILGYEFLNCYGISIDGVNIK